MRKIHITRLAMLAGVASALAVASIAMAADQKPVTQKVIVKVFKASDADIARYDGAPVPTNAGMRAYVDADTKQLRAATQAELESAAVVAAPAAAKRSASVAAVAARTGPSSEKLANGATKIVLDDSFLSYAVATVGPDGKVRQACVDQQPNQQAALKAAAQAGVDSHEK